MLYISLSLILLVVATPIGWFVVAAVIAACLLARMYKNRRQVPEPPIGFTTARFAAEASLLAFVPLAMLAFGLFFWRHWETAPAHPNERLLLQTLSGMCMLQVVPLGWFIWRHCRRLAVTTLASVLAALWSLGAQFASSMAITGNWL